MRWRRRKKRSLIHNGQSVVRVQTRHGSFGFSRLRFRDDSGHEVRLENVPFDQSISEPLRTLALGWVNHLSFVKVSLLIAQVSGPALLSEDSLWRMVQAQAGRLDAEQAQQIAENACLPEPTYVTPDAESLYEAGAAEFVTMTDGIGVKAQKPTRQKADEAKQAKVEKRHDTDVLILPRRDGGEEVVCEGVSDKWTLVEAAKAFLKREWTAVTLRVVALTDGAKSIRADLLALFGEGVQVILDWYHLERRVYQQLSMAAHSMSEREQWERTVLGFLWNGNSAAAQEFLTAQKARNARAMSDLQGYLDKHASEIIDYERRQKAGKPIGSGRMEKCVDQVVGYRQKGKGMSWTKAGTRALALLKAAELNARTSSRTQTTIQTAYP